MAKAIGDDYRDILNTTTFLVPLSKEGIKEIAQLSYPEIRERLREAIWPFARWSQEKRDELLHLPTRWVREAARCLQRNRG